MKKAISISAIILVLLILPGCATIFAPKTYPLSIGSEPDNAEVFVNDLKMGITPVELSLKADKTYTIEFRKEGYQSITRVVNSKVGAGWILLDVLGGFVPIVIDAATGSWYQLDQDAVNSVLERQNR